MKKWIFAHRGEWDDQINANSENSLQNALLHGFGLETDIRNLSGEIVISHDPCVGKEHELFNKYLTQDSRIAINVKCDGLLARLETMRGLISASGSFVFDCSFPELLKYKRSGIPHAIRISEYEKELYWKPNYIWLDAFDSDWWLEDLTTLKLIEKTPSIVVSPELHKRDYSKVWQRVLELRDEGFDISVCTDFPNQLALAAGMP